MVIMIKPMRRLRCSATCAWHGSKAHLTVTVIVADWVIFPAASKALTNSVCVVFDTLFVFQVVLNG